MSPYLTRILSTVADSFYTIWEEQLYGQKRKKWLGAKSIRSLQEHHVTNPASRASRRTAATRHRPRLKHDTLGMLIRGLAPSIPPPDLFPVWCRCDSWLPRPRHPLVGIMFHFGCDTTVRPGSEREQRRACITLASPSRQDIQREPAHATSCETTTRGNTSQESE